MTKRTVGLAFLLLMLCQQTNAHQMKEALTVVSFNAKSKHMEVVHRLYLHDAEFVAQSRQNKQVDLQQDQQARQQLAQYVISKFQMSLDESEHDLVFVGQENQGKFLWIYQEVAISEMPQNLHISFDAMMEFWPDQRNVINLEFGGKVQTLHLTQDKPAGTFVNE